MTAAFLPRGHKMTSEKVRVGLLCSESQFPDCETFTAFFRALDEEVARKMSGSLVASAPMTFISFWLPAKTNFLSKKFRVKMDNLIS